jgi:hypothetical protein
MFQDNSTLCNEVSEKVIQHFVHCIETHGKHVQYLKFLQTIVRAENSFIRKCQDMVMQEVCALCAFVSSIVFEQVVEMFGFCAYQNYCLKGVLVFLIPEPHLSSLICVFLLGYVKALACLKHRTPVFSY